VVKIRAPNMIFEGEKVNQLRQTPNWQKLSNRTAVWGLDNSIWKDGLVKMCPPILQDQQMDFVEASEVRQTVDKDYNKYLILLTLVLTGTLKVV
jgi:hypothetical protein